MRRQVALVAAVAASVLAGAGPHSALRAQEPERPAFTSWLAGVREDALARGIREEIVTEALSTVPEPLAVVLERDRSQAETVLPLETYISRRLSAKAVATGRQMYARHAATLAAIEERYGVPARTVVAVWGLESNFGSFSGVRPTIAALATLAWDPRRATYFRGELLNALEILNRGDIELARMKGSWAGAMGQPQFMPSSFLQFAEDHDGDGRRDIWQSTPDVFASIANYLKGHGWTPDQRWGREVSIAPDAMTRISAEVGRREGSCRASRDMTSFLPLAEWQRLGVRLPDGKPLPDAEMPAALVAGTSRRFLVYQNYDVLLAYNCAHAYALTVALLGDRIATPAAPAPRRSPARRAKARR